MLRPHRRAADSSSEWVMPVTPPRLTDRIWTIPFGGRLGWATAALPIPSTGPASRAFLLRGSGMVFSPEYGALCTRFRRAGLWAEDLRCTGFGAITGSVTWHDSRGASGAAARADTSWSATRAADAHVLSSRLRATRLEKAGVAVRLGRVPRTASSRMPP